MQLSVSDNCIYSCAHRLNVGEQADAVTAAVREELVAAIENGALDRQ